MRRLLLLVALAISCFGQDDTYRFYFVTRITTGANETLTIQQPASGSRDVTFRGALITSLTSCDATLELNGVAATGSATTPSKLNTKAPEPKALAYVASNGGVGAVIHTYKVQAGIPFGIAGSGLGLAAVAGQSYGFRTTCPSGTMITVFHSE